MERALQRYLRYHRTQNSTEKTLEWHTRSIKTFIAFLQSNDLPTTLEDGLKASHVRDWLDDLRERGQSQHTLATRARSLKAFSRWLAAEEWLPADPLARVKRPKCDDMVKPTFAPEEVETLLKACGQHNKAAIVGLRDKAIMLLLYSTGLRASELLSLQQSDIDWDRGLVAIRRGKGGRFRQVPLVGKAERALDRYVAHRDRPTRDAVFLADDGHPLTFVGLTQMLRRYEAWTGIHCNPHKFRHSAAVQYLRNGGRVETLKTMLGHTTLTMTLHYARIAGVDLTTAHETADPVRSLKVRI